MANLTVDSFFSGGDLESRQYLVLNGLKAYFDDFSHSRLYPALGELVELHNALEAILSKTNDIQSRLPHTLKEIDLEQKKLVYETENPLPGFDMERAAELITWALPHIRKAIEEGMGIYNFVEEHIHIEHVGIVPMYREEGYWFVPDGKMSCLHLMRYEVSLFTSANERFRTLKTRLLESLGQAYLRRAPESIKMDLVGKYQDLPNPATYMCDTDMDFPFTETMLPIAKRKFIQQIFS